MENKFQLAMNIIYTGVLFFHIHAVAFGNICIIHTGVMLVLTKS